MLLKKKQRKKKKIQPKINKKTAAISNSKSVHKLRGRTIDTTAFATSLEKERRKKSSISGNNILFGSKWSPPSLNVINQSQPGLAVL